MRALAHKPESSDLLRRYQALLEVGEVSHAFPDLDELFHNLAESLRRVIVFDGIGIGLVDEKKEFLRPVLVETWMPQRVELVPAVPLQAVPGGWVMEHQRAHRFSVTEDDGKYPFHRRMLESAGVNVSYTLPLSTSITRLGAILFAFKKDVQLDDSELDFMQLVADQVAVAIENAQNFEQAQTAMSELERRNAQQAVLLKLTNYLVAKLELNELLQAVATGVRRAVPCAVASVFLPDQDQTTGVRRVVPCACLVVLLPNEDRTRLMLRALDFPDGKGFGSSPGLLRHRFS